MNSPVVEMRDVTLARGGLRLVEGLNLSLQPGDIAWVQGPNGSGKSTVLRALCGFVRPVEGEIETRGDIAYVGHKSGLVPFARAKGETIFWTGREDTSHGRDQRVSQLSEGQRKKIALARLEAGGSQIWLLDEPYAALDTEAAASLDHRIVEHSDASGIAVIVSHQGLRDLGRDVVSIELKRS